MPALASLSQEDIDALAEEQAAQDAAAAAAPVGPPPQAAAPPPYDPAQDTQGMQAQPNYIAPAPAPTASADTSAQQTVYDPALQANVPAPAAEPAPGYIDTGVAPPESTQQTIVAPPPEAAPVQSAESSRATGYDVAPAAEPVPAPYASPSTDTYQPDPVDVATGNAPPGSYEWWTGQQAESTAAADMRRRRDASAAQGNLGLGEASFYPRPIPKFAQLNQVEGGLPPRPGEVPGTVDTSAVESWRALLGTSYATPSTDVYRPNPLDFAATRAGTASPGTYEWWTGQPVGDTPGAAMARDVAQSQAQGRWGRGEGMFFVTPSGAAFEGAAEPSVRPRPVVEPPPAGAIDVPYRVAPEPVVAPRERTTFINAPLTDQSGAHAFRPGQTTPELSARAPEQVLATERVPAPPEVAPPVRTVARPPAGNVVAGGVEAVGAPVRIVTPSGGVLTSALSEERPPVGQVVVPRGEATGAPVRAVTPSEATAPVAPPDVLPAEGQPVLPSEQRAAPARRTTTPVAEPAPLIDAQGKPIAPVSEVLRGNRLRREVTLPVGAQETGAPIRTVTPSEATAPVVPPDTIGSALRRHMANQPSAEVIRAIDDAVAQGDAVTFKTLTGRDLPTEAPPPFSEARPPVGQDVRPSGEAVGAPVRTVSEATAPVVPPEAAAKPARGQEVVPRGEAAGAPVTSKAWSDLVVEERARRAAGKPPRPIVLPEDAPLRENAAAGAPGEAPSPATAPVPPPEEAGAKPPPEATAATEPPPSAGKKPPKSPWVSGKTATPGTTEKLLGLTMKPGLPRKAYIGALAGTAASTLAFAKQKSSEPPFIKPTTGTTKAPASTTDPTVSPQQQTVMDAMGVPKDATWVVSNGVRVRVGKDGAAWCIEGTQDSCEPIPDDWELADIQARTAAIAADRIKGNPWITAKKNLAGAATTTAPVDAAAAPVDTTTDTTVDAGATDYVPPPEGENISPGSVGTPTTAGSTPAVTENGDVPLVAADGTPTGLVLTKDGDVKESSGDYSGGGYSSGKSYSSGRSYRSGGYSGGSSYSRKKKKKKSTSSSSPFDSGFWEGFPFNRPPSPIRQQILDAIAASKAKGAAKKGQ